MSVPASSKLNRFIIDGNFEGSENCSILVEKTWNNRAWKMRVYCSTKDTVCLIGKISSRSVLATCLCEHEKMIDFSREVHKG